MTTYNIITFTLGFIIFISLLIYSQLKTKIKLVDRNGNNRGDSDLVESNLLELDKPTIKVQKVFQFDFREIFYFFLILLGIICKEIFSMIREQSKFDFTRFLIIGSALIISPMVFLSIQSTLDKERITLVGCCIAFQNGFFWQTILSNYDL